MFCKNCGTSINDDAAFCPNCGAPISGAQTAAPQAGVPQQSGVQQASGTGAYGGVSSDTAREYLVRGAVGVAAILLAYVAMVFLSRLVGEIEGVITLFSGYDGLVAGLGIAGFIVCGILMAGCAALAALPAARFAIEGNSVGQAGVDRGIALSIALLVLCIAAWICKLIFHSPTGGDVSRVLHTIFSTFGETATSNWVPVIVAIVILYLVRTKMAAPAGPRY